MGYALDILDNKNATPPPFIGEIYNPVVFGSLGCGYFAFANWMNRRPLLAGKKFLVNKSSELCK
jgi:hypothetical protein